MAAHPQVITRETPCASKFATPAFALVLLAFSLTAYFVPYYDWDLVVYVGSAIALHEHDAKSIQTQAYAALRRELPDDDFADIAAGSDFRRDVARNAGHFYQQLRFYQIRPLYVRLLAGLHALGIGYVKATRLISAGAFAFTGMLLFVWARRYVDERRAAAAVAAVALLLITPALFTGARTGSPDAVAAFVVLLGVYAIFERTQIVLGAALLLLSLFLRTDNVIMVFVILAATAVLRRSARDCTIAIACALLSVVIVLGINRGEHSYSWPVLMQNTENPIVNPAEISPKFTKSDYLLAWREMLDEARENSAVVFPFIAVLALISSRTPRLLNQLVIAVLVSWVGHIVLFPHIEDRYFISGSTIIGVAGISALLTKPGSEQPSEISQRRLRP